LAASGGVFWSGVKFSAKGTFGSVASPHLPGYTENDDLAQAGEQILLSHQQAKTCVHALQDGQGKEPYTQPHFVPLARLNSSEQTNQTHPKSPTPNNKI
jgi:hypothetical protein